MRAGRGRMLLLAAALPVGLAAPAPAGAAGGTLQDQAVSLTYTSAHWGAAPNAWLYGTDPNTSSSPLYRSGWWYRVVGVDTREYPFPPPDVETYGADGKLVATWNDVHGKGFKARETTWVFDEEGPSGGFVSQLFVEWNSAPGHDIALFHFLDVDVGGSYLNDSATLRAPGHVKFTDGASTLRYQGTLVRHFMVAPYDNLYGGEIKRRLNDTAVDDLSDTGLPFGPGDVTAGFQFLAYAPYGSARVAVHSNTKRDYARGRGVTLGASPAVFFRSGLGPSYSASWGMRRTTAMERWSHYVHGGYRILAGNDFDGDAEEEYLFHSADTGALYVGSDAVTGAPPLPSNWTLGATADFDGDGRADILWRNTSSQKLAIWLMNGAARVGSRTPTPDQAADANWEVVGADDFDADGDQDLLFYNQTSGRLVIWHLDANQVRVAGGFTDPPSVGSNAWRAVAVGDFGRGAAGAGGPAPHGSPDILWQNDVSKKLVVWHMDLAGRRTSGLFLTPDACDICEGGGAVFGPR